MKDKDVQLLKPSFQSVLNLLQIVHCETRVRVRHAAKRHICRSDDLNEEYVILIFWKE